MFRSILLSIAFVASVSAPAFSRQPPVSGPATDGQSRATCLRQVESLHLGRVRMGRMSVKASMVIRAKQIRSCR